MQVQHPRLGHAKGDVRCIHLSSGCSVSQWGSLFCCYLWVFSNPQGTHVRQKFNRTRTIGGVSILAPRHQRFAGRWGRRNTGGELYGNA
jgi:hypothetical protein